ncbi:MAG TPA: TadE/TadG family type IV pilus assembly protein [Candidatus Saccharimonadales bacterium]|nr:TadE/TadG family type IV pilus assembly protein [Candidatus Saccharimonadales bacterium]
MKTFVSKLRGRKGQSIVEISLITPLLLVALVIPADFGVAFLAGNLINTAAREGGRVGSQIGKAGGNEDDRDFDAINNANAVKTAVFARMPNYVTNRSVTVKFYENAPANCLETIQVTASGDYNYYFYQILRLFGATVPNKSTISRTAQFAYRYQPYTNETPCTGMTVNTTYTN